MNRLISTLLLSMLSILALTQPATADRPAAEDSTTTVDAETAGVSTQPTSSQPVSSQAVTDETPQNTPSSVDIMMRQEQQRGDVLTLPPKEMQAGETLQIKLLDFPRRGMSMDKVRNEFGQPDAVSGTVGQPPITSWTYNDRIVYFEYSTVLHVVAR